MLSGGVGGARFLLGLQALGHDVTVIGNTGDDITMVGLRICPDLDTVMYTLGGGISAERGWGREHESFVVREELTRYGEAIPDDEGGDAVPGWFGLGDRDLATHLLRTVWLNAGVPLSEVTRRLCERWQPGVRLLPATDTPIETHVRLTDGRVVHFQEWWVRLAAAVPATGFDVAGAADSVPAPGVIEAIRETDVVILPPSNPVVSIGVILAVPGIASAVRETAAPVVGLSPIVDGAPVRGMADACLAALGIEATAEAVGRHYGPRSAGGLIDGWLVDTRDAASVDGLNAAGLPTRAVPLMMTDLEATSRMAQAALDLATSAGR
jgi:LPPG:FO 2-phospho-L-lactate transferase